jgi:hypothetical protein
VAGVRSSKVKVRSGRTVMRAGMGVPWGKVGCGVSYCWCGGRLRDGSSDRNSKNGFYGRQLRSRRSKASFVTRPMLNFWAARAPEADSPAQNRPLTSDSNFHVPGASGRAGQGEVMRSTYDSDMCGASIEFLFRASASVSAGGGGGGGADLAEVHRLDTLRTQGRTDRWRRRRLARANYQLDDLVLLDRFLGHRGEVGVCMYVCVCGVCVVRLGGYFSNGRGLAGLARVTFARAPRRVGAWHTAAAAD